jgi:arylsulfatase A-like enzyme
MTANHALREAPPTRHHATTGCFRRRAPAARLARALVAACLAVSTGGPSALGANRTARPNVVVIVSDDQGWADIGYHGSDVLTQTLDGLAEAGVRLDQSYVYPTCSPTRAALLAGRNPSRFGIHTPIGGRSEQALPTDVVTLPKTLAELGYRTAISGKWHLGLRPEVGPLQYGFASSYGYLHGQVDPYTHLYKNGDPTWHRNDKLIQEQGHATDLITDEAIRVIEAKNDLPFLLYVAYSVPHYPLDEPAEWLDLYDGKIEDPSRRLFAASLTHMDAAIGRIVEALDRTGKRKETILIFTSDNGGQKSWSNRTQYAGRYADKPHHVLGDNRPLRGWKGEPYEGGVRVAALVSWPGVLDARVIESPVHVMDWLPTLVTLAGGDVDPADQLEGVDIWPLLTGEVQHAKRTFYWNTGSHSALRHGDWKFIQHESGRTELFDLAKDPYETHDLTATEAARTTELRQLLNYQQELDP